MHSFRPLLFGLASATAVALLPLGPVAAPLGIEASYAQSASVSIDVFFDKLAPSGVWVQHPQYHYVFCPKVDANWRPYTNGHWVYLKSYGWYFASDEPFAWAVYHYGRWFEDQKLGWCWVPGNAWAGAWVSWRQGNDYVGWAPLEPDHDGFAVDVDVNKAEQPQRDWVFVKPARFLQPNLNVEIVAGDRQPDAFQKTKFDGPVVVKNNIVINTVIDINFIQQQTKTKVVVVDPKPVDDPSKAGKDASGTTIAVFSPQIPPPKQDEKPKQSVNEDQAQQQLGTKGPGASSSAESSMSSSAPSSSEASSSMSSSAAASSSAAPSSAASSSEAASSSAAASEPPSSAMSSSEAPSSAMASSAMEASSSSEAPKPVSSLEPKAVASSELSSSSEEPRASSSAEAKPQPSSSEERPASSSEERRPSSELVSSSSEEPPAPAKAQASSEQPKAAPAQEKPKPKLVCPDGQEIVDGKCVPIPASSKSK
ncbi:MAG TPA: DUF6600 domain-containing protein [Devosia sp.]|nr:DUF6600 domain-containing protein [Devosia sp.]